MAILIHKPYLVKVSTKIRGSKYPKIWTRGLWMSPLHNGDQATVISKELEIVCNAKSPEV